MGSESGLKGLLVDALTAVPYRSPYRDIPILGLNRILTRW